MVCQHVGVRLDNHCSSWVVFSLREIVSGSSSMLWFRGDPKTQRSAALGTYNMGPVGVCDNEGEPLRSMVLLARHRLNAVFISLYRDLPGDALRLIDLYDGA